MDITAYGDSVQRIRAMKGVIGRRKEKRREKAPDILKVVIFFPKARQLQLRATIHSLRRDIFERFSAVGI